MSLIMFSPFMLLDWGWQCSRGAPGPADVYYPLQHFERRRGCNVLWELEVLFKSIMGLFVAVRKEL